MQGPKGIPLKRSFIALALCLSLAAPAFAADPDPCVLGNHQPDKNHGGFPGTVLSADFDGDGIEDRACALLADLDSEGPVNIDIEFGPFDRMGYPAHAVTLETYKDSKQFGDKTLSIVPPGLFEALCNTGILAVDCGPGDETWLYTTRPSVSTGTEGASWMYVYIGRDPADPNKRLFRQFYTSD